MGGTSPYKELIGRLVPRFRESGFNWKPKEEAFVKAGEKNTFKVYLPFVETHSGFEYSSSFGIRLDNVEDIYHQFSATLQSYRPLTCTSVTRLSFLVGRGPDFFSYSNQEELSESVARFEETFLRIGLDFFDENVSLEALATKVNAKYEGEPFCITRNPSKALHGLILWWLAGFPNLQELAERYLEEMVGSSSCEVERVTDLLSFMGGH